MSRISRSPDRGSFRAASQLQKLKEDPTNEAAKALLEFENKYRKEVLLREETKEWQEDNLEYDLRTTDWILDKTRGSEVYAQNLYAALCNNEFQRNEVFPILSNKTWACSWRYAGGIIADMCETGDYIDWYCSGSRHRADLDDESYNSLNKEQQEEYLQRKSYVGEGHVTDEIREDLLNLGWIVMDYDPEAF